MSQELVDMSIKQWQAERQAYWDTISEFNEKMGTSFRTVSYRSSDEYYANLGSYIEERQQDATPVAGEGSREFFETLGYVSATGSKIFPPLRFVTLASRAILAIDQYRST